MEQSQSLPPLERDFGVRASQTCRSRAVQGRFPAAHESDRRITFDALCAQATGRGRPNDRHLT